jgi:predicted methyltransferase
VTKLSAAAAGALALVLAAPAFAQAPSAAIKAAVADAGRPDADKAKDAARKPAEVLAFAGVKPGMKVADFIMGGGYFTRILAKAVGPTGKVYAYQPAEFIAFRAAYADEQKAAAAPYSNVAPLSDSMATVKFAEPLDLVFTAQNYHDMHLKAVPAGAAELILAGLKATLKPGGTLLVIDHVAEPGKADAPDTLHRIDPAVIKAEIEKAGFIFDGESPLLRNPEDPHTALVFSPAIRGKTDQVIYRFKAPK